MQCKKVVWELRSVNGYHKLASLSVTCVWNRHAWHVQLAQDFTRLGVDQVGVRLSACLSPRSRVPLFTWAAIYWTLVRVQEEENRAGSLVKEAQTWTCFVFSKRAQFYLGKVKTWYTICCWVEFGPFVLNALWPQPNNAVVPRGPPRGTTCRKEASDGDGGHGDGGAGTTIRCPPTILSVLWRGGLGGAAPVFSSTCLYVRDMLPHIHAWLLICRDNKGQDATTRFYLCVQLVCSSAFPSCFYALCYLEMGEYVI